MLLPDGWLVVRLGWSKLSMGQPTTLTTGSPPFIRHKVLQNCLASRNSAAVSTGLNTQYLSGAVSASAGYELQRPCHFEALAASASGIKSKLERNDATVSANFSSFDKSSGFWSDMTTSSGNFSFNIFRM